MTVSEPESVNPERLVLVGGGHAHALLLNEWGSQISSHARLTVINPAPTAPYTGMLPGFVAGHYTRAELDYDLVQLTTSAKGHLVQGLVTHVDREAKQVIVDGHEPIPYDLCSINVGATSQLPNVAGFAQHAVGAKPLGSFANRWTEFLEELPTSTQEEVDVVVIGGGVAGSELAMAISYRLRHLGMRPRVTVIDRSSVLQEVGEKAHAELLERLYELDVVVRGNTSIERLQSGIVELANGEKLEARLIVGAAGVRSLPWLSELGLSTTDGFLDVGPTLQTTDDPQIFAVGDCAHMPFAPRPKAGVFAVRQAPVLAANIEALLRGSELSNFEPQSDYLKLISLGRKSAGADKFGRFASGPILWRLKDYIDRKFMNELGD